MPWRTIITPYRVVISEIMLQQTQVDRVLKKFPSFIKRFPTWRALARASTKEILSEWSGLGYNRRALNLHAIAHQVTHGGKTRGVLPTTFERLVELPSIGPHTAGSILAFAYNIPHPFIETNIRSVFIHHFFDKHDRTVHSVHDKDIMPLVKTTLSHPRNITNPREWYYALMDYGAYLKKRIANPSRKSAHYTKQSRFKGSNRELRSKILAFIMKHSAHKNTIEKYFGAHTKHSITKNLSTLMKEGFLTRTGTYYSIKG